MTQEELDDLAGNYNYQYHYSPMPVVEADYHFKAGFKKALELVSEAMNEGKDLIDEFDEILNPGE